MDLTCAFFLLMSISHLRLTILPTVGKSLMNLINEKLILALRLHNLQHINIMFLCCSVFLRPNFIRDYDERCYAP